MGVETKSCYVACAGLELTVDLRSAGTSGMGLCAALGLIVITFTGSHVAQAGLEFLCNQG